MEIDYEKAYKAALETATQWIKDGCTDKERICLESAFPQLRESEDERIRKLLVWQVHRNIEDETNDLAQSVYDGIKGHDPDLEESIEDWKKCLAYLEKQKEQKPAEWSEEDRLILDSIIAVVEEWEDTQSDKEKAYYGATTKSDWLKSLRPPQYCENCRLKKSVQGWKPSEEQMEALDKALYYVPEEIGIPIAEIYGHFNKMKKKLM